MKTADDLQFAFGLLYKDEVRCLREWTTELITMFESPTIVNIGAGVGTSGLVFAEVAPEAERFTIDISKGGPLGGLQNERNSFEGTGFTLPKQVLGDSITVGRTWDKPIHLLFVDGDHNESYVLSEGRTWIPLVVDGGLILWHDYRQTSWLGVVKAVNALALQFGLKQVDLVDTIIVFGKPAEDNDALDSLPL